MTTWAAASEAPASGATATAKASAVPAEIRVGKTRDQCMLTPAGRSDNVVKSHLGSPGSSPEGFHRGLRPVGPTSRLVLSCPQTALSGRLDGNLLGGHNVCGTPKGNG